MQFHLNGVRLGDPAIVEAGPVPAGETDAVDVLIVGSGPTGLTLAAQLAAFPEIRTKIVEAKSGPLEVGQADGIAVRSVEMFEAFGFAEKVLKEAYWVNETAFWRPDADDPRRICRSGRIEDTEEGLSEFPHLILNQARIHDFYLEAMRNAPARLVPTYSRRLETLEIDRTVAAPYPVTATFERLDAPGTTEQVRARYVVGCDGARSRVRGAIGRKLEGDSANQAWGVMDVLAVTDFPDIRLKCAIHSGNEGNAVIIPREGGYLVRLYIEMDKLSDDERVASKNITVDHVIRAAQRILNPYTLEIKEVAWWSVYEIGQRLCDRFDDVPDDRVGQAEPRVFIAGDACHTHSPKAGQGMNVSMADGFNLGWKLASVLRGQARPELLDTYSAERQGVARALIDFDREFARMFSAKPRTEDGDDGVDPAEFQKYFVKQGRFTAGTAVTYGPSIITGPSAHQHLASGFEIGMRLHSAPVIRLADAKPMQLAHTVKADGRWRLFAFAGEGHPADPDTAIARLCAFLADHPDSPVRRYTPGRLDIDAVIDLRAVFQQDHRSLALEQMPRILRPAKGRFGLTDYEKMFCPDGRAGDIFDARGIDRKSGAMVVIRPDQFVADILALEDFEGLSTFFARILKPWK